MGKRSQASTTSASNTLSLVYMWWFITHVHLFFRKHPLAPMAHNSMLEILVLADGQDEKVAMPRTRIDRILPKSVISKQKADETHGDLKPTSSAEHLFGSHGSTYRPRHYIKLRWHLSGSAQTMEGTFYIVENCEFDAVLGQDVKISDGKSGYYPLQHNTETPDEKREREARERERNREREAKAQAERDKMNKDLEKRQGQT